MAFSQDEERVPAERARAVGLFRYSVIREAADASISTKQGGRLVRELAEGEQQGPFGVPVRVSRPNIDRWIRTGAAAGSTPWCPTHGGSRPARRQTCWSWRWR